MSDTRSLDDETDQTDERPAKPAAGNVVEARVAVGDCLGRYTVRGLLGAGGMGEVFEGYDPQLERRVALKVLKAGLGGNSPEGRARFQREAQAMAQLNHPNVVAVYDVGTIGERFFVAMELVHGPTLARFIAEGPHSWREIVELFVQAGRGLEAAHAAGIVHRDFKPSNVILGDRVRVADFGLARSFGESDSGAAPMTTATTATTTTTPTTTATSTTAMTTPAAMLLDGTVTQTGQALGTPAYMAPEQRDGAVVTAQADQYAFCVALSEALEGRRVPRFLTLLVARGRSFDPAARFPSMTALLAELGRDRTRTRRWLLLAAGAAVLLAAGFIVRQKTATPPCADADERLAGIWNAPRKDSIRAAFAATRLPYSDATWSRVSARLDGYTGRWVDMANETCHATRVEGRQSDTLMDLRMACLERRRSVLGALVDLWSRGVDAETLAIADDAARGLAPIAECADARVLAERVPLPTDPAAVARIAAARARLDSLQALILSHHWAEARDAVAPVRAAADATGWPQVQAEAAFAEADVLHNLSDPGAEKPFLEANRLAGAAHDDRLAARALIELVKSFAVDDQRADRALLVAQIADGAVARAGNDLGLRAQLLGHRGEALYTSNQLDAARDAFTQAQVDFTTAFGPDDSATLWNQGELGRTIAAQGHYAEARRLLDDNLAATIKALGPEHPTVASKLNNLGTAAATAGDDTAAVSYLRRALALKEKVGGSNAAWTATTLTNLGRVEQALGNFDESLAHLQRALAIRERIFGPEHAQVATSLAEIARVRRHQGHPREAFDLLQRALAIDIKVYGGQHPFIGDVLSMIGDGLDSDGDFAGALDYYRRALAIEQRAVGVDHPQSFHLMNNISIELAQLHRCGEARPLIATATAGLEKALGPDNVLVGEALAVGGECDLAGGRAAQAAAAFERAIAIEEKGGDGPTDRGSYRWGLTRALWSLGRRDAAVTAARKAEQELGGDADGARDLGHVRAWLASHARSAD